MLRGHVRRIALGDVATAFVFGLGADDLHSHRLADFLFAQESARVPFKSSRAAIRAGISLQVCNTLQELAHSSATRPTACQRLCCSSVRLLLYLLCRVPKSAQRERAPDKHQQHQRDDNLYQGVTFFLPADG